MPTTTQHLDLLQLKVEQLYQNQTVQVCLSSSHLTMATSVSDTLNSELPVANGYNRIDYTFDTNAGALDSTVGEITLPTIEATFTASGGDLEWRSAFVLLGSRVLIVVQEDAPIILLDEQSHKYRIVIKERRA